MSRPQLDKRRLRRLRRKRGRHDDGEPTAPAGAERAPEAAPVRSFEDRAPAAPPVDAAAGEPATDGEPWDLKAALLADPDSGDAR